MIRFVAVYEGLTVSSARLLALSADERIVRMLVEELVGEAKEDDRGRAEHRGHIVELARGEREE